MFRACLTALCVAFCFLSPTRAATVLDLTEETAAATPSVVGIMRFDPSQSVPAQLIGTGFAIVDGRHIITNAHVLRPSKAPRGAKASFFALLQKPSAHGGKSGVGAALRRVRLTLIDMEATYDLALLRLPERSEALPPLNIVESPAPILPGGAVFSIGFPAASALGPYPAVSSGIISAVTPSLSPQMHSRQLDPAFIRAPRFGLYQLDMTAYPGQSGSPLIYVRTGQVIGVINATKLKSQKERVLSDPSGISYAIMAAQLRTFLLRNGLSP